jgi:rod shape-determining protein MreD
MKPLVYAAIIILLTPAQAGMFDLISLGGIKPDLALALLYIIGLLTGPVEAALAGMLIGLVQDIGSASPLGLSGFTKGLVGLAAGLLGRQVLDLASPSNAIFLAAFSLLEGFGIAVFMQLLHGSVPFVSLMVERFLPQALYTGALGMLILRLVVNRNTILPLLTRRSMQREF